MNRIIYLITFLLFSTFIISCSNEITEENKNDLERFEIEWTSHLELGEYFHQQLLEFENGLASAVSDSTMDTLKSKKESVLEKELTSGIHSLKKKYDSYLKKCKKVNGDWIGFKSRAMNDEITSDEAESQKTELEQVFKEYKKELRTLFYELDRMKVKSNE